jgi:hypothetical protein
MCAAEVANHRCTRRGVVRLRTVTSLRDTMFYVCRQHAKSAKRVGLFLFDDDVVGARAQWHPRVVLQVGLSA